MSRRIDARLMDLGITLPEAAVPVGNYVAYVISGPLVFVCGQIGMEAGKPKVLGRLGESLSIDEGYQAARQCALNLITQVKAACGGDLDRVKRVVRLGGFVCCTPDFIDQPKVLNGASDLMVEVFGDLGRHARTAVGVPALPLGVAVEIDGVFEIDL